VQVVLEPFFLKFATQKFCGFLARSFECNHFSAHALYSSIFKRRYCQVESNRFWGFNRKAQTYTAIKYVSTYFVHDISNNVIAFLDKHSRI
jgi:hypothetical protein